MTSKQQKPNRRVPARIKKLIKDAEVERLNPLSQLAMGVCRSYIESSFRQSSNRDARADARVAHEWFFHTLRAEKNVDTEILQELEEELEQLKSAPSIEDV